MTVADAAARAADRRFLGLAMEDGGTSGELTLVTHLTTPDDRLYGGCGIAVAISAMETATGRDLTWVTVQYVSTTSEGARIRVEVREAARGRRTSQVQLTATADGVELFHAIGATVDAKPDGFAGEFASMPEVDPPEDCPIIRMPHPKFDGKGYLAVTDLRDATRGEKGAAPDQIAVWARIPGQASGSPVTIGFVADLVPMSVARASGLFGGGRSLDNTLRMGERTATDWVLLDFRPELAVGGFGHGTVFVWAEDGTLIAVGSQTAQMRFFG